MTWRRPRDRYVTALKGQGCDPYMFGDHYLEAGVTDSAIMENPQEMALCGRGIKWSRCR